MAAPTIVTIRPGVQFTADAAKAFQRAEAEVQAERGRNIDVNSTYRDYNLQLRMFNDWQAYISGRGPKPNHSKALHPDDPLAFHTKGLALDSDDWQDPWIEGVLAKNGFIRNRLYVPNEKHHFEYIRSKDKNYGKPLEDDMTPEERKMLKEIHHRVHKGLTGKRIAHAVWSAKSGVNGRRWGDMLRTLWNGWRMGSKGNWHHGEGTAQVISEIGAQKIFRKRQGDPDPIDVKDLAKQLAPLLSKVEAEELAAEVVKQTGEALSGKG